MVALCSNRFEGFGPHSEIHPATPTACFEDVIVVPLATWIYMSILIILTTTLLAPRHRSKHSQSPQRDLFRNTWRRGLKERILVCLYCLLCLAMIALVALEIARLTTAELGIGLLPFSFLGIILAFVVHMLSAEPPFPGSLKGLRSSRSSILRMATVLFWLMFLVATSIKASSSKMEENVGYLRTGQQAKYPVDDSFVDNLTMACVTLVLAALEFLTS